MRLVLALLGTLAVSIACAAPPPSPAYFDVLRVSNGLPSSSVQALRQDADGFIWVGTRDGLARYDGVDFRVWRHDPADAGSLASSDVSALLFDRAGRLWCGGEASGVNRLRADGEFEHFRHDASNEASLSSDDVFTIVEDPQGGVWVGTYAGGLNRLRDDGTFERIQHDDNDPASLRSNNVVVLLGDARGRIWIGTDVGLDVREVDGSIVHVAMPELDEARGDLMVGSLRAEADGSVLVGTRRGVARIGEDLAFRDVVLGDVTGGVVHAIVRGGEGEFWFATGRGLVQAIGDLHTRLGTSDSMPGDLPGTRILDAIRDHEGGLWFAVHGAGIARLPANAGNFSAWRHRPGQPASLEHMIVTAVGVGSRGDVWSVSGKDGLDRIDPATGVVGRHGERLSESSSIPRNVLPLGDVLWVGYSNGLRRYPLDGRPVLDVAPGPSRAELPRGLVGRMTPTADGRVWFVVQGGGVAVLDLRDLSLHSYTSASASLDNDDVVALRIDAHGNPWVVGAAGVRVLDRTGDRFVDVPGAPAGPVHALAFDADQSLWLHRLGALERYAVHDGALRLQTRLDAGAGWPAMQVYDLHVAANGSLWAASGRGLWRVDARTHAIRGFGERDGLPSAEFAPSGFAVARDGTVFAATAGGVVGFDPASMRSSAPAPPLHVTALSLRRDGNVLDLDARARSISLRHDDRDLALTLRALSFVNPAANRYRTRLEPFDNDWVDGGSAGTRVFSQLPAGNYRLRARAASADGAWTDLDPPLRLHVAAAPWATPLAYLGYALVAMFAAAALASGWRTRVEHRHALAIAREHHRNAERLGASKSTFLATMSHEIRTPMTGVLGMTELLQRTSLDARQRGYTEAIARSGELMLRLVNDSLDLARIEAGKLALDLQPFDPVALAREVTALEEATAARKGLVLRLDLGEDLPRALRGDAHRIKQILLNLVSNALKFTERGHVCVELSVPSPGELAVTVADSGPGMSGEMRERLFGRFEQSGDTARRFGGSGLGLSITRELVDLMGGHIDVDTTLGHGTRFRVVLPLETVDVAVPATAPIESASSTDVSARDAAHGLHVLVVEDDATIAEVVSGLLAAAGHRSTHAAHGLAALVALSRADFDAALVDLDLPGIDGLQLARMLRQREIAGTTRLPLIAISARSLGNEEQQTREAGMDGFLRKPLTGAMLNAALEPWQRPVR